MTVREIQAFLAEMYAVEVSRVADALSTRCIPWCFVMPCASRSAEIRRVIDTTNALESVHARLRKIDQNPRPLSERRVSDHTALALRNLTRQWTMPVRPWRDAMTPFALLYQERFVVRPA